MYGVMNSNDALTAARYAIDHNKAVPEESLPALRALITSSLGYDSVKVEVVPPDVVLGVDFTALKGKSIALYIGHQPGGGARGERNYNKRVAFFMAEYLERYGATVEIFEHRFKSYTKRIKDTVYRMIKAMNPDPDVCIELHYDDVDNETVSGHHFQYLGHKSLALAFRDRFEAFLAKHGRKSNRRYSDGVYKNKSGNGSGFLKLTPCPACLTEPFMRSNFDDWEFWKNKHAEMAMINVEALAIYFSK